MQRMWSEPRLSFDHLSADSQGEPKMLLLGWFPPQTFSADAVNAVDNSHFDARRSTFGCGGEPDALLWCDTHS